MTGPKLIYRLAAGSLIGLACFAVLNNVLLLNGAEFLPISLPLALLVGYFLASPRSLQVDTITERCPVWLQIISLALIAAVLGVLTYGSTVTASRHWDGTVAWELKAQFLTEEPSLEQDFFRGEGVFHHSRDYPLLQPLCVAAGNRILGDGLGRLLFPCLYLLLLALLGLVLRLRCQQGWLAWAGMLALGLTPMLTNPVMGGTDSGFAELFLATGVAGIAAGLLLRDASLLAAATLVTVLVKPEGILYGFLPVVLLWWRGERASMYTALGAWCLGIATWLPLQHRLQQFGSGEGVAGMVLLGLVILVLGVGLSDQLLRRMGSGVKGRSLCILIALLSVLLLAPWLVSALGNEGGTLGVYLSDLSRPFERLPRIPRILYGLVERGMLHGRFALAYTLLAIIVSASLLWRRKLAEPRLAGFLFLGIGSLCAAFLLSPEQNLEKQIPSSMDRLLLHWLAPALLLSLICLEEEIKSARLRSDPVPSR